ncbi:MAG: AraC family transcriptional regulator [Opitutaceae bacterium]|jgi:AraC-like DNA-binding protein|nr:AraC family transcriptional regulator [Opitutaceae bacterium]
MLSDALICWEDIIRKSGTRAGASRYAGHSLTNDVRIGSEFQPPDEGYCWHGLNRGVPARHSTLTFQWTLEGEGVFEMGGKSYPQNPGQAFLVRIPSDHEYRVADKGPGWKFFYIILKTPWIVERLTQDATELSSTFPVPFDSRLALETLHFFQQTYAGLLKDRFDAEKAMFNWVVEAQRHMHQVRHPCDDREGILEQARQFYAENRMRSFGVEDFARRLGMSRVGISLKFQKITGQTPAAWFLEQRLNEAITLLGQGHKLEHVARNTGFADANHFCKVFKRAYHVSPGQFRKMIAVRTLSGGS